jgi:ubiquinone/menaquinone biosynthesis C-methylase UbiE
LSLHDPAVVRAEYQDESRLAARKAAHASAEGPDARELVFEAVGEGGPERVLEVGCGAGELAERMRRDLDAEVVAIDQSERMVELTRARGVDAGVGDVQDLDFPDGYFDCAVAAWMLYHAVDLDRALAELARVLRPGGRLVAATNGTDHVRELYELVGLPPIRTNFNTENASKLLQRYFSRVERRDAHGWLVFPNADDAQAYVDSMVVLSGQVPRVEGPIRARRTPAIFVAEK